MKQHRSASCPNCSAEMEYLPDSSSLVCRYCSTTVELPSSESSIDENSFAEHIASRKRDASTIQALSLHCESCGANTLLPPLKTAAPCIFCGRDLIIKGASTQIVRPQALLTFAVTKEQAKSHYIKWITSRWFLPSGFSKLVRHRKKMTGVYIPFWTYDCLTFTIYSGLRGEDYFDTESYSTVINGRRVRRTRQVVRTNWYPVNGRILLSFDDVVIPASKSLPEVEARNLTPWDLEKLEPFSDHFLSGFYAEQYGVTVEEGFDKSKSEINSRIRSAIHVDIGGDRQQIRSAKTDYRDVSFKHILLPIWLAAFRYKEKTFQVLINARTGEVQGERPWSWLKIAAAVLLVSLLAIALLSMGQPR